MKNIVDRLKKKLRPPLQEEIADLSDEEKKNAVDFYEKLRDLLSLTREGKQVITAFEKNPEQGSDDLKKYIENHIDDSDDPNFANKIAEALSGKESQFNTVVTGGNVDQIINIARLGSLVLNVHKQYFLFRDLRQLVTFLLFVIVVSSVLGFSWWWVQQPRVMGGTFNIAVAEFEENPPTDNPQIGPIVGQTIFNTLNNEAQQTGFENVQVTTKNIGVISDAEEAKELAGKINAHVVIYGTVFVLGNQASITPQFYVHDDFRGDVGELSGEHQLNMPVDFTTTDIVKSQAEVNTLLKQRTAILTEFTKSLVYLATENLPLARQSIDDSLQIADEYGDFGGKETIYLVASHVARLQENYNDAQGYITKMLEINPSYGRGYIGLGNIYYDQGDFFQAFQSYQQAAGLPNQPFGSYVIEKANVGVGNICNFQFQEIMHNELATDTEKQNMADCALSAYQIVIDSYEQMQEPETRLVEMAAWSYYGSGMIYQFQGDNEQAAGFFREAIDITDDGNLTERANRRLAEVN